LERELEGAEVCDIADVDVDIEEFTNHSVDILRKAADDGIASSARSGRRRALTGRRRRRATPAARTYRYETMDKRRHWYRSGVRSQ
jgi:hypothetical protein